MKSEESIQLLKRHRLKVTSVRINVLSQLARRPNGVSRPLLEQQLKTTCDRVTLYRVLNKFESAGIVYKVFDRKGSANFLLTQERTPLRNGRQHLHFNCVACNAIFCLSQVLVPSFDLPENFKMDALAITATGLCPSCASSYGLIS